MTRKPNILIIHPDQMRYDCAAFSGNLDVKTPHLDRLAMEGVCFDEAFASYPLCRPFRASFQTGKYPQRTGVYADHSLVDSSQPSLARCLSAAGYKTGYFGKWHLHNDFLKKAFVPPGSARMGYDHFVGFNRAHRYMEAIFYRNSGQPYTCRRFEPDFQTDHAIEFMEGARISGAPFLAYISFGPPHSPMEKNMPEHWRNMYNPALITLPWDTRNHNLRGQREKWDRGRDGREADSMLENESNGSQVRKYVAEYYGLISSIDFNVGRLLNWLDAMALNKETIVILFSDHGDMLGQNGSQCGIKNLPYRAAAQVPLLARFPDRFISGKRVNSLVDVALDTMPTLLQACGVPVPEEAQGISYLSLLEGDDTPTREHVQYQRMAYKLKSESEDRKVNPNSLRGIRTKDWLYVRNLDGPLNLFDQNEDRLELMNLTDDPAYAEIQAKLDAGVRRNMDETEDAWELEADFKPPGFPTRDENRAYQKKLSATAIVVP